MAGNARLLPPGYAHRLRTTRRRRKACVRHATSRRDRGISHAHGPRLDSGLAGTQQRRASPAADSFATSPARHPSLYSRRRARLLSESVASALASVPKALYGEYATVDRDEIERTNEVRRLILEYQRSPKDKRPLSNRQFSWCRVLENRSRSKKSAMWSSLKTNPPLEFNLTQMRSTAELHRALHQVRDASIRREIPLVFWDEFDTGGLRWLAEFLAPMQDAEFFEGGLKHPIGKCTSVFAGGTCSAFDEFKAWRRPDDLAGYCRRMKSGLRASRR